nr:MAG TPA: hypothetical protein [Caudoviricetes sp.]
MPVGTYVFTGFFLLYTVVHEFNSLKMSIHLQWKVKN